MDAALKSDTHFKTEEAGTVQGLANCNDSQDLVILRNKEETSTIEIWKQSEEFSMIATE